MDVIKPDVPASKLRGFVAHPGALLAIGFVIIAATAPLASVLAHLLSLPKGSFLSFLGAVFVAAAVIIAWKAYKRWIERAPDRELEGRGFLPELGAGLALGTVLFCIMAGIVALLGGLRVVGWGSGKDFWSILAMALISGVFEEVLFRGVVMRHLEGLMGTWWALALTSAFFGLAHLANPDSSLFAAFAIAVEAGILLGAAYLLTRRLWLAIGIHAAWNFTQGFVFSAPVSGGRSADGLLVTVREGPEWLTGGAFGLEASVVALAVATLAGLILLRRAAQKGEIRPWGWRKEARSPATEVIS